MTTVFRKMPVTIEARQLTRENGRELWEWADSKPYYGADGQVDGLSIFTLEGRMKANFGDWIVKGVKGEFYPVRADIFEATYEPVGETIADDSAESEPGTYWERAVLERFAAGAPVDLETVRLQVSALLRLATPGTPGDAEESTDV